MWGGSAWGSGARAKMGHSAVGFLRSVRHIEGLETPNSLRCWLT